MAFVPLAVVTIQRGLTVIHDEDIRSREPNPVPSPGSVDGIWGPRTMESLWTYISSSWGLAGDDLTAYMLELREVPARAASAPVPLVAVRQLSERAARYQGSGAGSSPFAPVGSEESNAPSREQIDQIVIGPALDPVLADVSEPAGIGTAAKIALGVLALGAVGGAIYWIAKKK